MEQAVRLLCRALKEGLSRAPSLFGRVRIHFLGTSYAPAGQGKATLQPVAEQEGVGAYVREYPDRLPYFEALQVLASADLLLIPGSTDPNYTASKLYPYIMAGKPILAAFNRNSSVVRILRETKAGTVVEFGGESRQEELEEMTYRAWQAMLLQLPFTPPTDWRSFEPYLAREMTNRQAAFFDAVIGCQATVPA
jgi:hypothetical protein